MTTTAHPQEDTARIKRDELLRLLNVTSPVGYQAITARTRLDEVAAELARTAAEPTAVVVADPPPAAPRKRPRPFSQVAAMLPAVERPRYPRPTTPLPVLRARTAPPVHSLAVPAPTTASTVAAVRDRLERGEDLASAPWLSARVAQHLTAEEVAMLPPDLQLRMPHVTEWQAPPRIELTPMPGLPCIDLQPVPAAAQAPADTTERVRAVAEAKIVMLAIYVAFVLLGACAIYAAL